MSAAASDRAPTLEVVVLAAGQGKRMRSALPKVLHRLGGRPLISHVLETVARLEPAAVHVVVGHRSEEVRSAVGDAVSWVEQTEQLGTGHAMRQALPHVGDGSVVLMVYGDVPLVNAETLRAAATAAAEGALAIVTACFEDPGQLGRIVRDESGAVRAIVEHADATPEQRRIREINSGLLALEARTMKRLLAEVKPHNAQGEYYITDLVGLAVGHNIPVQTVDAAVAEEVAGVNDRVQLAELERFYQRRQAERLMRGGVTIADPERVDIRGTVSAGEDSFIDVNVVLEGDVRIGRGVSIGANCVIRDARLDDGVTVHPHTVIDGAILAAGCEIGPFARLRPGTELDEEVKIGNFVETKKARLGRGTKANHLAYLGDATLGEHCNVGAGTVTCNYDGIQKHPTTIGDGVFVGTNSTLVAPLEIEAKAYIAAGSTITSKVEANDLGVGRARQRNIKGWKRPDRRDG